MDLKFTLVLDKEIALKMSYIGKYNGRSRIKEIEQACKFWIECFEAEHGTISLDDLEQIK